MKNIPSSSLYPTQNAYTTVWFSQNKDQIGDTVDLDRTVMSLLICFQCSRVPCDLCCAAAYSKICFRSSSDQSCLWTFSAAGFGALDSGFKGRIVAQSPRKIDMVMLLFEAKISLLLPPKSSHLRIFLHRNVLNFAYNPAGTDSLDSYIVNILIWRILIEKVYCIVWTTSNNQPSLYPLWIPPDPVKFLTSESALEFVLPVDTVPCGQLQMREQARLEYRAVDFTGLQSARWAPLYSPLFTTLSRDHSPNKLDQMHDSNPGRVTSWNYWSDLRFSCRNS